jgi:SET domain-containing protein
LRDIDAGEEITVNYNGHEEDLTPVGFEVIDPISVSPYLDSDDRSSRLGETVQIAAS